MPSGNLVREMEQRYGMMSLARTRSLVDFNDARLARGEPALPYILCVIDELADLMMVAPADVETAIIRLAAEGPRGRYPPRAGHPVPARRRDHRPDQGERAVADRLRGLVADGLPRDPRPERRRVAARRRRHAVLTDRQPRAPAHPGGLHRRAPDRRADASSGAARASPSSVPSCSTRSSRRRPRTPPRTRASTPTRIRCWRRRSPSSSRWGPRRHRCCSVGCGSATPGPAGSSTCWNDAGSSPDTRGPSRVRCSCPRPICHR